MHAILGSVSVFGQIRDADPPLSLILLAVTLLPGLTRAQQNVIADRQTEPGPLTHLLLGDSLLKGYNAASADISSKGIDFFSGFTAEVWSNVAGGEQRGAAYTGLLDFGATADFEKLAGWKGATFHTTWLWISGRNISSDDVGNFLTVSNIAGYDTLRMQELWLQQTAFDDRISLRIGQLTADSEFLISQYGGLYINGTFGWPPIAYMNIPNGGPGYPMGAPGVRVAINPIPWFTYQAAAFQGNVFPQNVNATGFRWRLNRVQGYFLINETQFRWNQADSEPGLPGQLKLGAWFDTAAFPNVGGNGSSWGNFSPYAVIDQQLTRESATAPATEDSKAVKSSAGKSGQKTFKEPVALDRSTQGLGWFGRISFAPQNRNFLGLYFDTGLNYTGLLPGRDNDVLGLALACANLTPDSAQALFDGGARQVGYEAVIEATYQMQVTAWMHLQPDLQYVIRPGGSGGLGNALVLGARVSVTF